MSQDDINVTLEPRQVTGKAVKHLRRSGQVPAVIHDHGKESVIVQGDFVALTKVWKKAGKHHPIQIKTGNESYVALIKDAEFDPKKHLLTHLVFNAVDKDQKVEADIPIHPRYNEGNESSPAERNSLIVLSQMDAIQVKALATKLPDFIEYDAEKLVEIGDTVTVADLIIPEGVEIETEGTHAVATVYEPSALAAANDAAGGDAEPETEPETEGQDMESESAEAETKDASEKPAEEKPEAEIKPE